jgi:hypothetical protein
MSRVAIVAGHPRQAVIALRIVSLGAITLVAVQAGGTALPCGRLGIESPYLLWIAFLDVGLSRTMAALTGAFRVHAPVNRGADGSDRVLVTELARLAADATDGVLDIVGSPQYSDRQTDQKKCRQGEGWKNMKRDYTASSHGSLVNVTNGPTVFLISNRVAIQFSYPATTRSVRIAPRKPIIPEDAQGAKGAWPPLAARTNKLADRLNKLPSS